MTDSTTAASSDSIEADVFDRASQAGWQWFTKFLLINIVVCILALLFVGIFTVWS